MPPPQHEVVAPTDLHDAHGHLVEPGWARRALWRYDRDRIGASRLRIKEWDYHWVIDQETGRGLMVTLADLGYLGLAAVHWVDLPRKTVVQGEQLAPLPLGRLGLGATPGDGRVAFAGRRVSVTCDVRGPERRLTVSCPRFAAGALHAELVLHHPPDHESLVIATSWAENRRAFYYNQKTACLRASGTVRLGATEVRFDPATASGGLDWGRGNWTWRNRWYWSAASGVVDGRSFGWNLGYGFSDRSPASENALFVDGVVHKLGDIRFDFDRANLLAPWRVVDPEGRVDLTFHPAVDRASTTNLGLVKSVQHQVFGHFSGTVRLDDGTPLRVDRLAGFAEDVLNWW